MTANDAAFASNGPETTTAQAKPAAAHDWGGPILTRHVADDVVDRLVTAVGLGPALVVAGAAYLVITSVSGLRPEWRGMDQLRGRRAGARA